MKGKRSNLRSSLGSLNNKSGLSGSLKTASRIASKLPEKEQRLSAKPNALKNSRPPSFDTLLTEDELKLVTSACDVSRAIPGFDSKMSLFQDENEASRLQKSKNNRKTVLRTSFKFSEIMKAAHE